MESFLRLLKRSLVQEAGSIRKAALRLGHKDHHYLERRLNGRIPLSVEDLFRIEDEFSFDIHSLLILAGKIPKSSPNWAILENLMSTQVDSHPEPELMKLAQRMLGRLEESLPAGGFDFSPSRTFFRLEAVWEVNRVQFGKSSRSLRDRFLDRQSRRHSYSSKDLKDLIEVIDLTARSHVYDVPTCAAIVHLGIGLPIAEQSTSRLYLEEIGCRLVLRSFHSSIARHYIEPLLPRAREPNIKARLHFFLAETYEGEGNLEAAIKMNDQILQLAEINSNYIYRARFNLATYSARGGKFEKSLKYLEEIPAERLSNPQFTFDILWLGGKSRCLLGDRTGGAAMMLSALNYQTDSQRPLHLLLLLEDLIPFVDQRRLREESKKIMPYLRQIKSHQARKVALRFATSLTEAKRMEIPLKRQLQRDSMAVTHWAFS